MTTRQIEAPALDTLSAAEVAVSLGYRDKKSVMKLVAEGKFPEPNEERKWFWEDVVWFLFDKRVRTRLRVTAPPPEPEPEQKPGRKPAGG